MFKDRRRVIINYLLPFYNAYSLIKRFPRWVVNEARFIKTKMEYIRRNSRKEFRYHFSFQNKCLGDWNDNAGHLGDYFWQDLWAAKLVYDNNPSKHYDIGSRIDGFIGHLACFRDNIVLIDVRPIDSVISGVEFICADATELSGIDDDSLESISALCSLEHFGLGRYGDVIDPEACFKAMHSIVRVLKKGGHAYVSVPVGYERLEFNAHRIFRASTIVREFEPLRLLEYSVINSDRIEKNVPLDKYDNDLNNRNGRFGLFHFVKE